MNIKEQLEQWIENRIQVIHYDSHEAERFREGANEMKELLLIAVEALQGCELYPNGYTNMTVKAVLAEIQEKIKGL